MKAYQPFLPMIFALELFALTGCATNYTLHMRPYLPPRDTSSLSPKLKDKKYSRIMIMPPSGTARGEFDNQISIFEKEFIKDGITPINGAVTGRVVMELQGDQKEKKDESAQNLSDVERALIMAKQTGADALLQIGQLEWSKTQYFTRYFVVNPVSGTNELKEVSLAEYSASQTPPKKAYQSPWLTFIGRLTDVQSGEVMASFEVKDASNWNLPADYMATISSNGFLLSQNYVYETTWVDATGVWHTTSGDWVGASSERAVEEVIAEVAKSILALQNGTPAPASSAPTTSDTSAAPGEGSVGAPSPAAGAQAAPAATGALLGNMLGAGAQPAARK